MAVRVDIYNGKYTYIFDKDGARALRYGEEWRDCCGDGFILALAQRIEHLEGAMKKAFDTPVSVKHGSAEQEELQQIYDVLSLGLADEEYE